MKGLGTRSNSSWLPFVGEVEEGIGRIKDDKRGMEAEMRPHLVGDFPAVVDTCATIDGD